MWKSILWGVLIGGVPLFVEGANAQTPEGRIRGTVIDERTQSPLSAAAVRILGSELGALSGADGVFMISGVPTGTHALAVTRFGYAAATVTDVVIRATRSTEVVVALTATATELEGILVGPGAFPRRDQDPTGTVTFSAEEIRRAPGIGIDVSRTLATIPAMAQLGEGRNDLLVRGGSSMENGFFVDNIPVPNINHFPNEGQTGGPIGMLNVGFIRDVEVSVGGFSALHGDRLSSIVEIRYRDGDRESVHGEMQMGLSGIGVGLEGPIDGGRGAWWISGTRSYLDLLVSAIGTGVAPRYGDLQGKLVYDLGARHSVNALALSGQSAIDFDRETDVDDDFYGRYSASQWTYGVNWRALWSDRLHSNTAISASHTMNSEEWSDRRDDRTLYQSENSEGALSLRNVNSLLGSGGRRFDFGFALSFPRSRYDYHYAAVTEGPADRHQPALDVDHRLQGTNTAAFLSTTVPISSNLSGTAGFRLEHAGMSGRALLLPRASATYTLTQTTRLNGAAGRYAQTLPLFFASQDPENRFLPHVQASHYVLGAEFLVTPALRVTAEVYRKDYSDLPLSPAHPERLPVDDLISGFDQFNGPLQAGGRAFSRGVELLAQHRRVDRFHGLVSVALSESRYRALDGVWRSRINDNRVTFQTLAGFQPNRSWDFSARWIYGGGAPYTPVDVEQSSLHGTTIFDFTRTNAERLPAYHTLHLRADRWHHFRRGSLVSYVTLSNAYNRKNIRMYWWNRSQEEIEPIWNWGLLPIIGFELKW